MTPTIRRLKTRQQFLKVAGTRQKWVSPGLILQYRRRPVPGGVAIGGASTDVRLSEPVGNASPTSSHIGLGFTVSRKVGNAVQRNRARRRLRAASAIVLPDGGCAGYDYVLIGRKETLTRDFSDLLEDLRTALKCKGKESKSFRKSDRRTELQGKSGLLGNRRSPGKDRLGGKRDKA
ncbi:MAG: ribonuclease P protein component [Pseudomonadota bacterium]